ncbi:RNA-splicing ligase RtcB [Candidatus Geothermarchaeota archaeon ex4572_27]|nr:MAG: RNA-splicing ligase RtcB [Candidatus Geothermarchaeota archaeon ex4572_27]
MPREELTKLEEAVYEIPKSGAMRVPARIYATEKLLRKMYEDRTFIQAKNVATLPGIYKFSIVLPDGHEGYGFPIGGVAAMDAEEGCISPGGVGYDINCLPPGTKVLGEHGYHLPIEEVRGGVICLDEGRAKGTRVVLRMRRRDSVLITITTRTGLKLRATPDHPILTPSGMVEAARLKPGDKVATYPFEGVSYEDPGDMTILGEEDFEKPIAMELSKRGLLPLNASNPKLPILAKLLGYFIGDGAFDGKKTWFYGDEEGLEEIRRDIMRLGYTPSRIIRRRRRCRIGEKEFTGNEHAIYVSAKSFRALLEKLGAPSGRKPDSDYGVPWWLKKMPMWVKRLFLAAYFGAEMSKPQTVNGFNFERPFVSLTKYPAHAQSGRKFLLEIAEMLREFGVDGCTIREDIENGRVRLKLFISSRPESLLNLWSRIGYIYSPRRMRLALAASSWLRLKLRVVNERRQAEAVAVALHSSGVSVSEIANCLESEWVNKRFIERSVYDGRKGAPRVPRNLPTFEEWVEANLDGDVVWDVVENVKLEGYDGYVYDITVEDESHNFVAEGFVVSNCGVRLMTTNLSYDDVKPVLKELVDTIFRLVPSGLGSARKDFRVSMRELDEIVRIGAPYIVEKFGLGFPEDLKHIEENGSYPGADPSVVSSRAKQRGLPQIGTLGSGNHFLEVQVVDKIYDERVAKAFGITHVGQITIMVHTGSRGFGHQVCSDYLRVMERAVRRYGIRLPDRELAYAPADSPEAEQYLKAFACAVNYAFANRQAISHWTREAFVKVFKKDVDALGIKVLYDIAHNIVKIEEHRVDGVKRRVFVHRKGATRSLPAGHPLTPKDYKSVGQPVLIPGSMGTASYVLVGVPSALERSFGSAAHGSGRMMSRAAAKRAYRAEAVLKEMSRRGILVRADSMATVVEEVPDAYKDVDEVAYATEKAGLAKRVARMVPIAVVKG